MEPMGYTPFSFDLPEPMPDAPKAATEAVRHIVLPDGEHWVKVRGGGTQREGAFISHLNRIIETLPDDRDAREAALYTYNRGMATFLADRVVEHNLTYTGTDEPLPLGMALFYEMHGHDALRLVGAIQRPSTFFVDPKAEKPSGGG
jgi:hypothetical protein